MNELIPHMDRRSGPVRPNESRDDDAERTGLQVALTRATHDINNPLAVISGNAQLLLELSRVLDLDPDVAKPIKDIEEASHQLAIMVQRLNALNEANGTQGAEGFGGDGM